MAADSRKRRRVPSDPLDRPSHLPAESINPHSHTPGTLRQFALAGLSDADVLPETFLPGFPHRPLKVTTARRDRRRPANMEVDDDSSFEDEDDSASVDSDSHGGNDLRKGRDSRRAAGTSGSSSARELHRRALRDAVRMFLDRGDVALAKRSFRLLVSLPSRTSHLGLDLRRDGLWSLGAEILMREGEERVREATTPQRDLPAAWPPSTPTIPPLDGLPLGLSAVTSRLGLAVNMPRVRAYFDTLIAQYPYHSRFPRAFSSLHLYPSIWGWEIYNIHAEHRLALQRLATEAATWEEEEDEEEQDASESEDDYAHAWRDREHEDPYGPGADDGIASLDDFSPPRSVRARGGRRRRVRDQIRKRALEAMLELTERMDQVLAEPPFDKAPELVRLRAVAALYVGDLVVPEVYDSQERLEAATEQRVAEQRRAQMLLARVKGRESDGTGLSELA